MTASAPGKIILFGEHAVVGGEPAVATCLSLRTWCRAQRTAEAVLHLELASLSRGQVVCTWPLSRLEALGAVHGVTARSLPELTPGLLAELREASQEGCSTLTHDEAKGVSAFLMLALVCRVQGRGLTARVWSDLPVGAGLGSSAAFSASVCGALTRVGGMRFCGEDKTPCGGAPCAACKEGLNGWTYHAERVLHGSPSGIDNSVAIYGGALSFVKGKGISVLPAMPLLPLLLVDTRVGRSTQALVAGVLKRKEEYPAVMQPTLAAIGHISQTAIKLFGEDYVPRADMLRQLGTLIDMNQGLLECIGVSHSSIRQVINATAPCKLLLCAILLR